MTKITWGDLDQRHYEFGVDRAVVYHKNGAGFPWYGLVTVREAEDTPNVELVYIDGVGHENQLSLGNFSATIEAITYPEAFERYDGYSGIQSKQSRKAFDFCYRTMQDQGHYKLHLVYNAFAAPSSVNHSSLNDNTDVSLFSWNLTTIPEVIPYARASSHFIVDSRQVNPGVLEVLEDHLYGTEESAPDMPTVLELIDIFEQFATLKVINHGDGSATIIGPDDAVYDTSLTSAIVAWPSVIYISSDTARISSL